MAAVKTDSDWCDKYGRYCNYGTYVRCVRKGCPKGYRSSDGENHYPCLELV